MHVTCEELETLCRERGIAAVEYHLQTTSTNDCALRLAHQPLPSDASHGLLGIVLANRQSAGRGRRSKAWWSGDGALMLSLLVDMDKCKLPKEEWPKVSLTTGLAVCEALGTVVEGIDSRLKWPNDVYANGKKVCGILIEVPAVAARRLVIGIGINVYNSLRHAPGELQAIATSLVDEAGDVPRMAAVLAAVLDQIQAHLAPLIEDPLPKGRGSPK